MDAGCLTYADGSNSLTEPSYMPDDIEHPPRGYNTDDDNLKEVDLGSGNTVTYRKAGIN